MSPLTPGRSATILGIAIVTSGAADFIFAVRRLESLVLGAVLTVLAIPWALLLFRSEELRGSSDGAPASPTSVGSSRRLIPHAVAVSLVVAFLVAKWRVYFDAGVGDPTGHIGSYRNYTAALLILLLLGVALRGGRVSRLIAASAHHPARLMAATFGLASVLGALLLALPVSLRHVRDVSLLDSLFVSVSAVCVTGLGTVNIAETYSFAGQLVLCLLMQIGGLGIMVLAAAVTMFAGRRIGIRSSAVLAEMVDAQSLEDLKRTVRTIVAYTLIFELAGATLLYFQFEPVTEIGASATAPGDLAGAGHAAWAAIFHSVSAFTNASFSNFRGGLSPFVGAPGVTATIGTLIVVGGLGFPVIHELLFRALDRVRGKRPRRLTLNTRVGLATTAILLFAMTVGYLILENGASFRALSPLERLNAALFQSAAARTAGFSVVDVAAMRPATLLITCLAMFIGGDPGSCAGGIKTTTLAVLFAVYRAELRGKRATLFDRSVPDPVIRRAMGVAFASLGLVVAVVFFLLLTEDHAPLAVLFETVSAFSTTGLSMGITPDLSVAGKLLLSFTMFVGRVGPLTLALALATRARRAAYELPEERVMIG